MHTVTATAVSTTDAGLGDTTETTTETVVLGALFAPEGATESVDARSPNVIGRASLYGAFPPLNSDDRIEHDPECCSGAEFEHGTWQVVGGSRGWGPGLMVVPIDKAAGV